MTNRLINPSIGAGYSDGEIAEIIANVVLNTFTDYINHIAQTEIDFPKVSLRYYFREVTLSNTAIGVGVHSCE